MTLRLASSRLLVSMKSDMIKDEIIRKKLGEIKFGQYEKDSLPTVYLYTEQVLDRRLTYNEVLEKNLGFPNPSNVEVLAEELGLSNYAGQSSLFSSLQHQSVALFSKLIPIEYFRSFLFLGFLQAKLHLHCVKLKLQKWPLSMWQLVLNISKLTNMWKLSSV